VVGAVQSEPPGVEGAAPAESAQLEAGPVGVAAVDVGGRRPEADVDAGEFGRASVGVGVEAGAETVLDRRRGGFIAAYPAPPAQAATVTRWERWAVSRSTMAARSRRVTDQSKGQAVWL
jgi:hypothetical protein